MGRHCHVENGRLTPVRTSFVRLCPWRVKSRTKLVTSTSFVGAVRLNTAFLETTGTSTDRSVHFRAEDRLARARRAHAGDEGVNNISTGLVPRYVR